MREQFGAVDPKSWMLRFHTQTGGITLTAQQPLNNVVRVAYQALAAVLGGTQSLHTNGFDEALALPTEQAATLALRTQQILAEESGVADTADPLAGSWFIGSLTAELRDKAQAIMADIEERGGAVTAIEKGFVQDAISENAYRRQVAQDSGAEVIVGVNKYTTDEPESVPIQRIDLEAVQAQIERVRSYRATQDAEAVSAALDQVRAVASGSDNLLWPMKSALRAGATLGQICDILRGVFGVQGR
jgi:methylmalonyl-CoA mutase N-terminal domain/subunit